MSERNESNNISDKEHGDYTTIDLENCDIYRSDGGSNDRDSSVKDGSDCYICNI